MGRKSIERERKPLTEKAKVWVRQLVPLIQDRPLDKLTLDELAELMGKSKSTIYSYFSTKEEIYLTAVQLILEDLQYVITEDATKGENMDAVLRSMLLQISEGIEGLSISFLEQIKEHFPEVWSAIEFFTTMLLANLEKVYNQGMEAGDFKEFNVSLLIAMDRHFVMSIMTNTEQFSNQGLSLQDLVQEYVDLRLSAIKVD